MDNSMPNEQNSFKKKNETVIFFSNLYLRYIVINRKMTVKPIESAIIQKCTRNSRLIGLVNETRQMKNAC